MLGSMHSVPNGTTYADEIMTAFDACETIACEVDTIALSKDRKLMNECTALMLCPSGTTTSDYLGESYESIKKFMKREGIYNSAYDSYLPIMWSSTLTNNTARKCGYNSDNGTEAYFLSLAKKQGKNIIELETAIEQYTLLALEPQELVRYTLDSAVKSGSEGMKQDLSVLYNAWASGDGETLERLLMLDKPSDDLMEAYSEYYNEMYTKRQKKMSDSVIEWLENGDTVFMFVGALHYFAEPDIIDNVNEYGYTVVSGYNDSLLAA